MRKTSKPQFRFAVCVNNKGYEASLEVGKLYRIMPDEEADKHGYIRVVDESGKDYGFSTDRFFPVELPEELKNLLVGKCNRVG